jgi:hypothetical protein
MSVSIPKPVLACLLSLCALLAGGLLFTGAASAAIVHQFEPTLSKTLSAGVPKGCALEGEPPIKEPPEGPCVSGASGGGPVVVAGGSLWLTDSVAINGQQTDRVDRFDPVSGAFVAPQLDHTEATGELIYGPVGVAEAFGEQLVYVHVSAGLAVYGASSGKLLGIWSGAHTANGGFSSEASSPVFRGVAADESVSGLDVAKGDVYVATSASGPEHPLGNVVDVFSPKEAAHAGEEPAGLAGIPAELHGTCTEPGEVVTGATPCEHGTFVPFTGPLSGVTVSPVNGDVLVDDAGVLDVFEPGALPGSYTFVRRISEANGTPLESTRGLAVDGNGDIYDAQRTVVDQFSETGAFETQLTSTPTGAFSEITGVGVDPVHHGVFVSSLESSPPIAAFGPSILVPDVEVLEPPEGVTATGVTLRGNVDPDGNGEASCEFEYGLTTSYGNHVECEHHVPNENRKVEVHSKRVGGLRPDTTYHYRLDATNLVDGHTNDGLGAEDEGTFTTTGPGLHGESVSEVASDAASLDATINPNGLPTSYYFQYVDPATEGVASTEACPPTGTAKCPTIPATPEALGSVPGDQNVSQRAQSLAPSSTYHYRVVVVSEPPGGPAEPFAEPDRTFTTEPSGSGFALPDGRAWELVTPPDKHGATPRQRTNGVTQASLSGDKISYLTTRPTEEGAPGYGFLFEQVLSTRAKGGWESQDLSAPHVEPLLPTAGRGEEYRIFSEDLSSALVEPFGEFTSLRPDVFPLDTEQTPYLRHDLTCASSPSTCYEPLLTAAPGYADVPPGTHFGGTAKNTLPGWSVMATTPDLTHVILGEDAFGSNSKQPLKSGAPSKALYEWSANAPFGESQLQLVSVLPDGTPTEGTVGTGEEEAGNSARAVSDDGARVVWTHEGALYLTDMSLGRSVRLGGGIFQTMNNEGSRVIFSEGEKLYECAIVIEAGAPQCKSREVAPGAGLLGQTLVGAGEDGNYVYFVSNNVVGQGVGHGAVNGNCTEKKIESFQEWERATPAAACNLYMVHYSSGAGWEPPALVGVLSGDDESAWLSQPDKKAARVSPDGRWLAFMSNRSLTGYDNRDVHSGKADEEVFLYHAGSGAPGSLVCASCDPTGARPTGFEVGEWSRQRLAASEEWQPDAWLAGSIPGWTGYTIYTALYQSRYLFDSGRLFFNSSDALVPQDINNQVDVYQFEPANTAPEPPPNDSCTTGSSTYHSATGGCVNLISSGTSHQESGFYDASATGDDVFFLTTESLVPQDPGGALSIYDAHVCGAEGVPCTPSAVSPPPCTTEASCKPAPEPQPSIFGSGPSETFVGAGNPAPPSVKKVTKKTVKCKKNFVKNKKGKCVKKSKKKKTKAQRAGNNRRTK